MEVHGQVSYIVPARVFRLLREFLRGTDKSAIDLDEVQDFWRPVVMYVAHAPVAQREALLRQVLQDYPQPPEIVEQLFGENDEEDGGREESPTETYSSEIQGASKLSQAISLLRDLLADGVAVPVSEVKARMSSASIGWRTVLRAKDMLQVQSLKQHSVWAWRLSNSYIRV
jgi:hypothetical protein